MMHEEVLNELEENIFQETIIQKLFGTSSSFPVKKHPAGKSQYKFLRSFWLVLKKFSFWQEY